MNDNPNWVRPVYLHLVSLFAIALMAFGAVGVLLGLVHLAAPDLKQQSDPIGRIAQAVTGVVQASVPFDQIEGGGEVQGAIRAAQDELRKQARNAAANDLIRAALLVIVGAFLYRYHERLIAGAAPSARSFAGTPPDASPFQPPSVTNEMTPPVLTTTEIVPPAEPRPGRRKNAK